MPQFEWDENKNKSNIQKHSIGFGKAKEVFEDKNAIEFRGSSGSELRILIIGKTLSKVLIALVYTMRSTVVRIISARSASNKEAKSYLEHNLSKQSHDEDEH